MSSSKYIAGLMGPLLMAVGLAMLLNQGIFPVMTEQLANSYGLVFVAGMVALVAGLAVVRAHNLWVADWRVIVTILGWLAVVGGLGRMLIPNYAAAIAGQFTHSAALTIGGLVALALGAFLSFKGYEDEIKDALGQRGAPSR
jgi:hypothetical protein